MVREIKNKNLFQLVRQSVNEIGLKTISAYATMLGLFVVITITFILAQTRQDFRQRAAETVYVNCAVSGFSIDSEENKILNLINEYRVQKGLSTLSFSSYLNRAAEWKSKDMVMINDVSKLAHSDSTGRKYNQMIYDCGFPLSPGWVGENLAANSYKDSCSGGSKICTADKAFDSWKKSPLHNENLLTASWTKIGIARNLGATDIWYWSTEFGDYNDGTNGSYIESSSTPTAAPIAIVSPAPTSQVTCVNQLPGTVTFNWTQQQSDMCYEIYYTYTGGSQTINAGCNINTYTIPGFSPGLVVSWQVRAFSGSNIGPYTSPVNFTVPSSCTSSSPTPTAITTPTPTPLSTSLPHLLLWSASCTTDGTIRVAFNWSGSNSYGYTLSWGSPTLGTNTQTILHAIPGTYYSGFSSGVDVEYQVWGNNSSGIATYPSDNGSFVQMTPQCLIASTATPTPTKIPTPTPTKAPTPTPTPTPTLVQSMCPGGSTNCANSTPSNYDSCTGTPNYLGNTNYDNWCYVNYGGTNAYCYSCIASTPTLTPTPTPAQVCTPNAFCGSVCGLPCYTSDLYCNSTGTACNVQVGNYYGDWCGCPAPTPTPTPTKAPTPTPTLAMTMCPGGTTNCANNIPSNYTSCTGTPNYLGNTNYNNWCLTYAGGANSYCYSCTASTPTPTPTPVPLAPHLQLWDAYCSNGAATIAFNWTGTSPYGYTLKWGSPWLYNYTQTISYARSGTYYAGFSSNVDVEYQVWANNSSGVASTPSDNGSFIQRTPLCTVAPPTPTPTTATVSSCPSYDSSTGYNNICTTNPCIGGSTLYKSGTGDAACAAAYGSSYGTCCMVTQPNGCPNDGYNSCRQTGCFAGETNVSSGNAACASAFNWNTGYCCR